MCLVDAYCAAVYVYDTISLYITENITCVEVCLQITSLMIPILLTPL